MAEQELIVHIGADIQAFQSAMSTVQSSMQNTASSINSSISGAEGNATRGTNAIGSALKSVGGILAGAFAVDKLKDFGISAIEAGANSQAMKAQFSQVFGDIGKDAQKTIDGLGKDFGMVPERISPAMTQMTSMFKGLGMNTKDAMSTAKEAVTVTADSAAFYDKSFEDANASLNSFIKGNYEGGESIGLFSSETQMASWASKNLGVDWKTLNEAGKQTARLKFAEAMQKSAGATGQASRESNSYQNQLGNLHQVWTNFQAKLAEPFLQPLINGLKGMAEWLGKIDVKAITDNLQEFGGYIKDIILPVIDDFKTMGEGMFGNFDGAELATTLLSGFKDVLSWLKDNTEQVTATIGGLVAGFVAFNVISSILGFIKAFQALMVVQETVTIGATIAQWALNSAFLANPIVWIAIAIGALIAIVILLWKNWDSVSKWLSDSWEWIKGVASSVWGGIKDFFKSCWEGIKNAVSTAWNWIVGFLTSLWSNIKGMAIRYFIAIVQYLAGVWNNIKTTASNAWNGFKTMISNIWDNIKSAIKGKIDKIKDTISGLWTKAKEIASNIKGAFSNLFGGIKVPHFKFSGSLNPKEWIKGNTPKMSVSWYKTGGIFTNPSLIGVGEAGDEAVVPLNNKSHVRPFAKAVASLIPQAKGQGFDGELIINVNSILDGKQIAESTIKVTQELINDLAKKQNRLNGQYA